MVLSIHPTAVRSEEICTHLTKDVEITAVRMYQWSGQEKKWPLTGVHWKIWPWCWQWVFICVGLHVKYYCFCYRSMLTTLNKYISFSEASVWMVWAFDFNLILFTAIWHLPMLCLTTSSSVHTVLGTVSMCELCTANVQFAEQQSYIIIK